MKTKKITRFLIFILACFLLPFGTAAWSLFQNQKTTNSLSVDGNTSNKCRVTLHTRSYTSDPYTKTEYYVPTEGKYTISHNISATNASGGLDVQRYEWKNLWGIKKSAEFPKFYDVNNGKYSLINEWSNGQYADSQIHSFNCVVSEWSSTNDLQYKDVWDCTVTKNDGSSYRLFFQENSGRLKDYTSSIGDVIYEKQIGGDNGVYDANGDFVITSIYLRIVVDKHYKYTCGFNKIDIVNYTHYSKYQIRKEVTRISKGDFTDADAGKTIYVENGKTIKPVDLGVSDYNEYGYYCDSQYTQIFDFTEPISKDTDIYVKLIKTGSNSLLANKIKNISSGAINLYDSTKAGNGSGSSNDFNVIDDSAYDPDSNILFLGKTNIVSNVTLKLTYGNAETNVDPAEGSISETAQHRFLSNSSIAYDYNGSVKTGLNNCSLYVALTGDMYVKGSLIVGAEIGGTGGSYYSYIGGRYTILDLHGNNLYIDGGDMTCFGVLKDTIGGGKVYVTSGGKITATLSVTDGKGKNQSIIGFAKRQAPFSEYKFAYLQAPIRFYEGSTLQVYLKIDLDDIGITNLYFNFITSMASNSNNSLFCWKETNNDKSHYMDYDPEEINELKTNEWFYLNYYFFRNRFSFHANVTSNKSIEAKLSATISGAKQDVNVDLMRMDFPISSFIDFAVCKGYQLDLYSLFCFYPGSSLNVQKGATLKLCVGGVTQYKEVSKGLAGFKIIIPGETRCLAGGIVSYVNSIRNVSTGYIQGPGGVYSQGSYWQYLPYSNISIDGTLLYDNSISNSTYASQKDNYYVLSGRIDLSSENVETIRKGRNCFKTNFIKGELASGFVYGGKEDGTTYASLESEYELCYSYNVSPLITSTKSYAIDGSKNSSEDVIGSFDVNTGIFTAESKTKYAFISSNYMYEDGNAKNNQSSKVSREINLQKIKNNYDDYCLIETDSNKYIRFSGVFAPLVSDSGKTSFQNGEFIVINSEKFLSNKDAPLFCMMNEKTSTGSAKGERKASQISSSFSKMVVKYYSSYKAWYYFCFADFPKKEYATTGSNYFEY